MTTVCDSCGSDDIDYRTHEVLMNEDGVEYYHIHHCICNQCCEEWVE